jgi:hypothetical protein
VEQKGLMTNIVTDDQVVEALNFKHHQFTTKFCNKNNPVNWTSVDHIYFKHLCTVLKHAEAIFSLDVDALANKEMKLTDD